MNSFRSGGHVLARLLLLWLCWVALVQAGAPPADPMPRIETGGQHTAVIRRLASDAQGRWLVTASDDKTARIWDLKTGALLRVLRPPLGPGHEGKLFAVALSPDGATVAVGGWTGYAWDDSNAIYLMDRASGRMLRRLADLPNVVQGLAFSPDGAWLAAGLGNGKGIRVWRTADWRQVYKDSRYWGDVYGVDFSRDNWLAASCEDGEVRLYRPDGDDWQRVAREKAPGGERPYAVRFSPDGERLAVGFNDRAAVNILGGRDLKLLASPDTTGVNGNLNSVAWADGALYAGGTYKRDDQRLLRRWERDGRGAARDQALAGNTVMDLRPLPDGGLVYASADPAWGRIGPDGQPVFVQSSAQIDPRDAQTALTVSRDGRQVGFGHGRAVGGAVHIDLGHLASLPDAGASLVAPRLTAPGLEVSDWRYDTAPKLNGRQLELRHGEVSRALAIAPDEQGLVLGASWSLRRFDRNGEEVWAQPTPDEAWAVNISGDGSLVVVAYGDGSIRWHRYADGQELLAWFPHADGKRWVAWTPAGYYAASPGGEDLIGWHVNRDRQEAADFYPASRFRERFYRPDVASLVPAARDEAEALRQADLDAGRKHQPQRIEAVLPPVVELLHPVDGTALSQNTLTLRYRVRGPADAPVTGLKLRVNGQPVQLPGLRNLVIEDTDSRELTLTLPRQDSEILLFAENRNGTSEPARLNLLWAGQQQAAAPDFKPKLYVLAVGVSDYDHGDINDLRYAAKDARDFVAAMQAQQGLLYRAVEVRLLTDAEAGRDNILDGLEWLQREVGAKDVGMFFLAGHGVNDPTGVYYYLPRDADPQRLKRSGLVFSEIKHTLAGLAGKSLFFIDTCHAGNILGGKRRYVPDVTAVVNELASAENGVVVFSSSTGREYSEERDEWRNGAFTKALLEGLGGQADVHRSGRITHKMLDFYISERVKALTEGRQHPVTQSPLGAPDFPLAVLASPRQDSSR